MTVRMDFIIIMRGAEDVLLERSFQTTIPGRLYICASCTASLKCWSKGQGAPPHLDAPTLGSRKYNMLALKVVTDFDFQQLRVSRG